MSTGFDTYADHMDALGMTYGPEAMILLGRIAVALKDDGYAVRGPYDMSADDYKYSMLVTVPEGTDESGIDVSIEIVEERSYDDSEGWGINFGLTIVHYGGLIIGGLQPYNFTPNVWVDSRDADAVKSRWMILNDNAVIEDTVTTVSAELGKVQA